MIFFGLATLLCCSKNCPEHPALLFTSRQKISYNRNTPPPQVCNQLVSHFWANFSFLSRRHTYRYETELFSQKWQFFLKPYMYNSYNYLCFQILIICFCTSINHIRKCASFWPRLWIRSRMDPHSFSLPDPDPGG